MSTTVPACKVCQDLEIDAPNRNRYDYAFFGAYLKDLSKTASEGCRFCKILLDIVEKSKQFPFPITHDRIKVQSYSIGAPLVVSGPNYGRNDEFQVYRIEG